MDKKKIMPSAIITVLYLAVMTGIGLFGETAASIVRTVAPYFFATLGLAVVVIVPYRVMWAMDRNAEIKRKIEEEKRIARQAAINKKMREEAKKYDQMNGLM